MNSLNKITICLATLLALSGCVTSQDQFQVPGSRLANGTDAAIETSSDPASEQKETQKPQGFVSLQSLQTRVPQIRGQQDAASQLSASDSVTFSADAMPAEQFVHAVLGDVLKLNYVIAPDLSGLNSDVTLNVTGSVSSRALFLLASSLLDERGVTITLKDNTYFVHAKSTESRSGVALGIGRQHSDVPQVVGQVLQIVPIKYGMSTSLERTLLSLLNAQVTPDFDKNMLFITAERSEVLRALDLINLLDLPAHRGRNVGILRLVYMTSDEFIQQVNKLLNAEGLPVDSGTAPKSNIVIVPLEQIGAVALFATDQLYIDRVTYWAQQLDKPSEGAQKRYYIFHPRFARASDLGASVAPLISVQSSGSSNQQGNQSRDTASAFNSSENSSSNQNSRQSARAEKKALTVQNEDITLTVDERSNTLIFYTTGVRYQDLLPMVQRLDVMPKQILLETTIAEVSLTDDLSMGLEFALSKGDFAGGTQGAFGVEEFGGMSLSYIDGAQQVLAALRASKTNVNVLSNPSLVVRDGVNANINVGTDVPTVGSTTVNPGTETQSTTVEYRKTGVKLSVTPTINAQGLVVLEIDQSISNTTDGGTVAGSPAIFERSIQTEVLAQSGQTILLGGLISENTSKSTTKVPFFGDLPVIGNLFRGQKDTTSKTELVILITPKVIDQPEHWQQIQQRLRNGLQNLKLED